MACNTLLDNISKLNTFVHMSKSNELLSIYVEKITNNKSQNMKFVNDFDYLSLDLLYTSLQLMSNKETITKVEFDKLDKKELSYYMRKKTILHELAHIELNHLQQVDNDLLAFKVNQYEDEADRYVKFLLDNIGGK